MLSMNHQMSYYRNHGCRILTDYKYKDIEIVIIENEILRVGILLGQGTTIYELFYKPFDLDLLWKSPRGISSFSDITPSIVATNRFMDFNGGGWQEMFPNVERGCRYKNADIATHGEVWGLPWNYEILDNKSDKVSIKFWVRTIRVPFYLEKILSLTSEEATLYIKEKVINEAEEDLDFIWGHHIAFGSPFISEDCKIITSSQEAYYGSGDLDKKSSIKWPIAKNRAGRTVDLSQVLSKESRVIREVILGKVNDSSCRIVNQKLNLSMEIKWDKKAFPYLLLHQDYGGIWGYPWYGRSYRLMTEPISSRFTPLDKAIEKKTQHRLKPEEIISGHVKISIIEKVI